MVGDSFLIRKNTIMTHEEIFKKVEWKADRIDKALPEIEKKTTF